MRISEIYREKKCVFSIECFPPKKVENFAKMKDTLLGMKSLSPDFMSVTFGAGGSAGGVSTVEIADYLKNSLSIEPVAHLICMGASKESVSKTIADLAANGTQNILALRGDETELRPRSKDFVHASDLMEFIRSTDPSFCYAGACYSEGHPESDSPAADIEALVKKQAAGAEFLLSQLFFDNSIFYRFLSRGKKAGLTLSISAGIMPIVKTSQIERTVKLSSASLPSEFTKMIARYGNDEASLYEAGIDYAVRQIRDLIEGGVDGIHLYAMNNLEVAKKIHEGIRDLL